MANDPPSSYASPDSSITPAVDTKTWTLPHDILTEIVRTILRQQKTLTIDNVWDSIHENKSVIQQLGTLNLVHSSLRPVVRHALGQRMIISDEDITDHTRNPLIGPWTEELVLNCWIPCTIGDDGRPIPTDEWSAVQSVLGHAPYLRLLGVDLTRVLSSYETTSTALLQEIKKLSTLEELWWSFVKGRLGDVAFTVSKLPLLRKLVLYNATGRKVPSGISKFPETGPHMTHALTCLTLKEMGTGPGWIQHEGAWLSWFLSPQRNATSRSPITRLALEIGEGAIDTIISARGDPPMFSSLQSLSISWIHRCNLQQLNGLLSLCNQLRSFTIEVDPRFFTHFPQEEGYSLAILHSLEFYRCKVFRMYWADRNRLRNSVRNAVDGLSNLLSEFLRKEHSACFILLEDEDLDHNKLPIHDAAKLEQLKDAIRVHNGDRACPELV